MKGGRGEKSERRREGAKETKTEDKESTRPKWQGYRGITGWGMGSP